MNQAPSWFTLRYAERRVGGVSLSAVAGYAVPTVAPVTGRRAANALHSTRDAVPSGSVVAATSKRSTGSLAAFRCFGASREAGDVGSERMEHVGPEPVVGETATRLGLDEPGLAQDP
jgi:hypothetical protein